MSYLSTFLLTERERIELAPRALTKLTRATPAPASVSLVRAVSASPGPDEHKSNIQPDNGLAVREVLTFPAALLGTLPLPTKLVLDVPGIDGAITIATHAACGPATFNAAEWLAIVQATENDRAWPQHFAAWCEHKQREPRWLLTQADAVGPIFDARAHRWTVGQVVNRLGATLRLVVL